MRSLVVHLLKRVNLQLSRTNERWMGLVGFVVWIPRLIPDFRTLVSKSSPALSGDVGVSLTTLPTVFINLEGRRDRRFLVERELLSMGILDFVRFPAIRRDNGSLGCAESHIQVLEDLASRPENLFMVCEDDLVFTAKRADLDALLSDFYHHPRLDVLCISYRLKAPRLRVSRYLAIANGIQTTSGYIVRKSAIPVLLESFRESRDMLIAGKSKSIASIDMHWKKIQTRSLRFAIPIHRSARQRPSYSDIAQEVKDYGD